MAQQWHLGKIGLLDFWYYDEQEFDFIDGRMLLRGANGSGKSVTMQSFIPLLLDGNMRPERLDPFGSRARKMENYLLEEGDERIERTGYLYMELLRQKEGPFLTLGIGLRARRGKKLETWYFCITDGRRVGIDLLLYKDKKNKITCTKQELKNRIGEGGRVIESQSEYMQTVNRLLFGFETIDEYQELLELLIQLRTPKLSKDFKPTVINEILSRSLQTLSEDDLRPMSEAIENMDSIKVNLEALRESTKAASQIERVYDQYNRAMLRDKALLFTDSEKEVRLLEGELGSLNDKLNSVKAELSESNDRYTALKEEEMLRRTERKSLEGSDGAKLKDRQLELQSLIESERERQAQKLSQEDEKKERQRELERERQLQSDVREKLWEDITDRISEMGEILESTSFDEFDFFQKELTANPDHQCDFDGHIRLFKQYRKNVQTALSSLRNKNALMSDYNELLEKLDAQRLEHEQLQRKEMSLENELVNIKSLLLDSFYRWDRENETLHLSDDLIRDINRLIDEYSFGDDYSDIREAARAAYNAAKEGLLETKSHAQRDIEAQDKICGELSEKLNYWKNISDPEPERSEEVKRNRELLRENNIPFVEFYRAVNFADDVDEIKAGIIEKALLEMGLLDALIVPSEYREAVMSLGGELCDRYLFADVSAAEKGLNSLLKEDITADTPESNSMRSVISKLLSAIGVNESAGVHAMTGTDKDAGVHAMAGTDEDAGIHAG